MKQHNTRQRMEKRATAPVLAIAVLAATALPARAYYFSSGRYWGGNMLYSLPYFGLSFLMRGFGPYNSNPFYSATSLLKRTSSAATYKYPLSSPPYVMQPYNDPEPLNAPRQRFRPKRLGQTGVDQVAQAQWRQPPATPGQTSSAIPQQPPGAMPPVAPPLTRGAAQAQGAGQATPIAQAFVNRINERFNGNIETALFDPDTRSLAHVLGIIDNEKMFTADFSEARVQIIRQILQDPKLSAVKKLQTMKILMSGGANRAIH